MIKIGDASSGLSHCPCQEQGERFASARRSISFLRILAPCLFKELIVHASGHMLEVCRGYGVQR